MKHIAVFAISVFLLVTLAGPCVVSAQDHAAIATVPFNFNVGNKWAPAGKYVITSNMSSPGVIKIRSNDGKIGMLCLVHRDDQQSKAGALVFKKYGDQLFLHQILCSRCGMNVVFEVSKHEKLARTRLEAGLLSESDVLVALTEPLTPRRGDSVRIPQVTGGTAFTSAQSADSHPADR